MSKRPAPESVHARAAKRAFRGTSHRPGKNFAVEPGWSGILVTCTLGKETFARREVFNLLNEAADELYGAEKWERAKERAGEEQEGDGEDAETSEAAAITPATPATPAPRDVESDFSAELASLQATSKDPRHPARRFAGFNVGISCVIFVRTQAPVDPVQIVSKVLKDARDTGVKKTRHCNRLSPLTKTCLAVMQDIEALAAEILAPIFHAPDAPQHTYAILLKMRDNDKFDRMKLIERIATIVGPHHKVDLTNPRYTVIVEVFKMVAGMSVVTEYNELKKFNIFELTAEPDVERKGKPRAKKQLQGKNERAVETQDGERPAEAQSSESTSAVE
ncbi:hypothetical protein M427DRAFT_96156 [Gonapodya prolifera JEL478]|uniref:THUMP domain-containing protein n=1 Tax=Gonapodya prolifera (strain JEL478) TaxID=1344416 RepID=A0A139ANT1_GONPJ|nr:hypothetical protein M427DRAFT_96156 [Gonapodya prolifera JEL478]|eukprot:KXS18409.1 hypothetical protein M427DRAFT_96156 [Gonapodya prolifera JEL478]